jgi:hypothetical protein
MKKLALTLCLLSMNTYAASQSYGPQHHMGVDALYNMNEKCMSLINSTDSKINSAKTTNKTSAAHADTMLNAFKIYYNTNILPFLNKSNSKLFSTNGDLKPVNELPTGTEMLSITKEAKLFQKHCESATNDVLKILNSTFK